MTLDPTRTAVRALKALGQLPAVEAQLGPEHGGVLAANRPENDPDEPGDSKNRRRRQRAMAAVAKYLSLPTDTEIDIDVRLEREHVTFLVRNRATGELLRELPEAEAQTLVEQLREFQGTFVDRSL